jgi:hypothetical protein
LDSPESFVRVPMSGAGARTRFVSRATGSGVPLEERYDRFVSPG